MSAGSQRRTAPCMRGRQQRPIWTGGVECNGCGLNRREQIIIQWVCYNNAACRRYS